MLLESCVNAKVTKINNNKMIYGLFSQLIEVKLINVGCEFQNFQLSCIENEMSSFAICSKKVNWNLNFLSIDLSFAQFRCLTSRVKEMMQLFSQ